MDDQQIWNDEREVAKLGIDVPVWIEQGITPRIVAAIVQDRCASGAYMPAVTYYQATQTMAEHGDAVLQFIQDSYGELPRPRDDESWSGLAVFYLSVAVELWASSAYAALADDDDDDDDDD